MEIKVPKNGNAVRNQQNIQGHVAQKGWLEPCKDCRLSLQCNIIITNNAIIRIITKTISVREILSLNAKQTQLCSAIE